MFWRLDSLPFRKRQVPRPVLIGIGAALWLLFFIGREFHHGAGALPRLLDILSMHWMGSVVLVATCLLVADVVTGFGYWWRPALGRVRTIAAATGLALAVIAHIQGLRPPVVRDFTVAIADLPRELDGTTVAVISDLHVGEAIPPRWLSARVDQLLALDPDMIVLVGDLFDGRDHLTAMADDMARLSAPLGVYAVRGNHDRKRAGRADTAGEILAGTGVALLENRWVEAAAGLIVAGTDDLTSARRRAGEGEANLAHALAARPPGATILLSHTPWLPEPAAAAGVDLMLSGHTHGGQLWPFGLLVRSRYPYVVGRYDVNGMTLIVTRGAGSWGPRMRLWAPGEILRVTLRTDRR